MPPQPPPRLKHQQSRNEFGRRPLPSASKGPQLGATDLDPTRQGQRIVGRIRSETRGLFLDWRRLPILLGYSDQRDFSQSLVPAGDDDAGISPFHFRFPSLV